MKRKKNLKVNVPKILGSKGGWRGETVRHSNARKLGMAGPYYKPKSKKGWYGYSMAHRRISKGESPRDEKGQLIQGSVSDLILEDLKKAQRRLTAVQIAKRTHSSWQATKKHLEELSRQDLVERISVGERTYWKFANRK